jgi:hypothetical protein
MMEGMDRFEAALQAVAQMVPRVTAGWPGSTWEWDGRLNSVLSTVAKASEEQARASLAAVLPQVWTASSLAEAPVLIRTICARTGGLLAGQLAFSGELPEGVFAYALWWPWGSGANVSVRIGVSHESVLPAVRAAFAV